MPMVDRVMTMAESGPAMRRYSFRETRISVDDADGTAPKESVEVPWSAATVIAGAAAFTLVVGVWPNWLIDASKDLLVLVN